MNIDELNLIEAPLSAININLNDAEISIAFKQNGEIMHLHFLAVRKLSIDLPEIVEISVGTIFDVITEAKCTGNTRIKFALSFGQTSGELDFEYSNVKLKTATAPLS